jgi:hypothetical protein
MLGFLGMILVVYTIGKRYSDFLKGFIIMIIFAALASRLITKSEEE